MTNFLLHMEPGRANFLGHVAMGYCFFFLFQSVFIQCEMDPILIRVFDVRCLNSATSCCYRCGVKQFECEAPKVNIFIFLFPFFFFCILFYFCFCFFRKKFGPLVCSSPPRVRLKPNGPCFLGTWLSVRWKSPFKILVSRVREAAHQSSHEGGDDEDSLFFFPALFSSLTQVFQTWWTKNIKKIRVKKGRSVERFAVEKEKGEKKE